MTLIAPKSDHLIEILALLFPESSRNTIKAWLKKGRVIIENRVIKQPQKLIKEGTPILLNDRQTVLELGIELLYEDNDIIVIDKPSGVLSVATPFEKVDTVHDVLKRLFFKKRIFPVHRLDREASGVLVFACSEKARTVLKGLFLAHTIHREYRAVVEGQLDSNGTWESFLKEDAAYFVKSYKGGKHAITHYEVLKKQPRYTYLKLKLETGRKNQIRVQASEAGFPIIGDQKYGAKSNSINRLGLHAHYLAFLHPISQKPMSFYSKVPLSFERLFK